MIANKNANACDAHQSTHSYRIDMLLFHFPSSLLHSARKRNDGQFHVKCVCVCVCVAHSVAVSTCSHFDDFAFDINFYYIFTPQVMISIFVENSDLRPLFGRVKMNFTRCKIKAAK